MRADVRRKLEMATRVRDFGRAHLSSTGNDGAQLKRLDDLIARAEGLAAQERAGRIAFTASAARRRGLRHAIQQELLHHLSAVGEQAVSDEPKLSRQFRLPASGGSTKAFVTATRLLLEKAESQRELLAKHGMSDGLLEELVKMLDDFDATVAESNAARRDHVGARAELEVVAEEIGQQVSLMDGLFRFRFRGDSERMAAWTSAKNVVGPTVRKVGRPASGDGEANKPAA